LVGVTLNFSDKLGLPAEDRDRLQKQCQALSENKEERAREVEKMLIELTDKLGTKAEPSGMN
jgi:hypothetical protein